MEEITEENIKKLIAKVPKDTGAIERLVLANDGTVQTLLSVLFNIPIKVEVIAQKEYSTYIIRWAKLVAEYSPDIKFTVCLAESVVDKTTSYSGFINGLREKKMGVGQLLSSLHINTDRELLGFHSDDSNFSRTYSITSVKSDDVNERPINIIITEVFPKAAFRRIDDETLGTI